MNWLSRLTALIGLALLSSAASAFEILGSNLQLECAFFGCGKISGNPEVYLLSVNPDPLPTVNMNDSQTVDLSWSVQHGLRSDFELCLTKDQNAIPDPADDCVALTGSTIVSVSKSDVRFSETATVPGGFYRDAAAFYIRSTVSTVFTGQQPRVRSSNRRPFVWPLPLTNLHVEGAGVDFPASGRIYAEVDVYNRSTVDAFNVEVQLDVAICDGNRPPPQRPMPEDSSDILCYDNEALGPEADPYLDRFQLSLVTLPQLLANRTDVVRIDITSILPALPRNLWISVYAIVDPDDKIKESNESPASNTDDGTAYVPRP